MIPSFVNHFSFDFETTGLRPHTGDRAFAYCIGNHLGEVKVYQMDRKGIQVLKEFFADTNKQKVMHNAKFDLSFLQYHGVKIPKETIIHDTMIQSQMLRNLAPTHSLAGLCWELCGYPQELDKEVKQEGRALGGYDKIPKHKMLKYQKADGERTMLLHMGYFGEICEREALYQDYLIEMRLIFTTLRLEQRGIHVHRPNCNKLINWLSEELDIVNDTFFEEMGYRANLGSPKQVQRLLFTRLGLSPLKMGKDGPSVDMDTINFLREATPHPVLDMILKYRTYTKGVAMVGSYLELAGLTKDGRLFPTINTNGAKKTGRESSENPNLQNVSKNRNARNPYTVPARSAFKAAPGCVLFLVDYAGIEMRLIVDACGQKELMKIINAGGDVHMPAVECFYGKKYTNEKNPTKKKSLRDAAKNAHFGMAYGASIVKLASTLSLSITQMKIGFSKYAEKYPEVAYFTQNISKEVKEKGYVTTAFGRRLYVLKHKAYIGANYKIQGSAGGVIKRAQVYVDDWTKKFYPQIRIVLPIHDEVLISYPKRLLKIQHLLLPKISRLMLNIPGINVRLDVEWKMTSTTWDKAKEIKVEY